MFRIERWLIYVYFATIPLYGFSFFNIAGLPFGRPDLVVTFVLSIVFLADILVSRRRLTVNNTNLAIVFFIFAVFLSLFNIYRIPEFSERDYFTIIGQLIAVSTMFIIISNLKVNRNLLQQLFQVWVGVACLVATYGIYQVFGRNLEWSFSYIQLFNPSLSARTAGGQFGTYIRPSSFFVEPARFGAYLVFPCLLLGVSLFYGHAQRLFFRRRIVNYIVFAIIITGLALAFSLGAYISFFAALSIFLFREQSYRVKRIIRYTVSIAILFTVVVLSLKMIGINFSSAFSRLDKILPIRKSEKFTLDASIGTRLARSRVAFEIWMDHPLIGVGPNQIQHILSYHYPLGASLNRKFPHSPHDIWSQVLASTGIVGFMAFAFIWGSTLILLIRTKNRSQDQSLKVLAYAFYFTIWAAIFSPDLVFIQPIIWINLSMAHLVIHNANRLNRMHKDVIKDLEKNYNYE